MDATFLRMDEFKARRVVDALRDRGVNAHLFRGAEHFGVRVTLPGGREAEWDTDGTAGLEAQVMQDGMLVGYVPEIEGSEDFDEFQERAGPGGCPEAVEPAGAEQDERRP